MADLEIQKEEKKPFEKCKITIAISVVLSMIGFFISVFLIYQYSLPYPMTCTGDTTVNTCEVVRNSEYSSIFGVSIPYYGAVFFIALAVLSLVRFNVPRNITLRNVYAVVILLSVAFEIYLTYVQFILLKASCVWCLLVEFVIFVLFIIFVLEFKFLKCYSDRTNAYANIENSNS